MFKQYIFFRHKGALKKLDIDEIVVMEANDNYIKIIGIENFFTVRISLQAALKRLPSKKFIRVHRSYVVSLDYIESIDKGYVLLGDKETSIPVPRQYYQKLARQLVVLDAETSAAKKRSQAIKTFLG
jgi:DNA-binding LytR/AlgR family response regulator